VTTTYTYNVWRLLRKQVQITPVLQNQSI